MKSIAKALSLGLTVCASVSIPVLIGVFVDEKLASKPIGVLIGFTFSVLFVFGALWELVKS